MKVSAMTIEELEKSLNEAMKLRAVYDNQVVDIVQEVRKRGLTLVWDNEEFSGKYYNIKEKK